jgi:hypothetical protein
LWLLLWVVFSQFITMNLKKINLLVLIYNHGSHFILFKNQIINQKTVHLFTGSFIKVRGSLSVGTYKSLILIFFQRTGTNDSLNLEHL